jgi:hypothetical protein
MVTAVNQQTIQHAELVRSYMNQPHRLSTDAVPPSLFFFPHARSFSSSFNEL